MIDETVWSTVHAEPGEGVDVVQILRMAQMWSPQMPKAVGGDWGGENLIL
jgi:hypothetical protein